MQGKEIKNLTPEEAALRKKHVNEMFGLNCPMFLEVASKDIRTLIGLGTYGMHVRFFDTRTVNTYDESKAMDLEETLDEDVHSSVVKNTITGMHIIKRRAPKKENPEEIHYWWTLCIDYLPARQLNISFGDIEGAAKFKNILWAWRNDQIELTEPISQEDATPQISAPLSSEQAPQ